jgi:MYXO-CTERM domain-containing protein
MRQSAQHLYTADESLHGGVNIPVLRRVLTYHGLDTYTETAAPFVGAVQRVDEVHASPTPIPNAADETITIVQPGATAIRVHFASMSMETSASCEDNDCDNVYVYDAQGRLYARYGGSPGAFASVAVPGDTIQVRYVSDRVTMSTGFAIDFYEYVTGVGAPDAGAALPDAAPATPDASPSQPDASASAPDANPTAPDAGGPADEGGGCGCRVGGGTGEPLAAVLALAGLAGFVTRRRRRR